MLLERDFFFFFAKSGTSVKSHATHAVERGISVEVAWILRGFCVGFARNLILFLFERECEGYKRFADCTVHKVKHHRNSDTKTANRDDIRTTALERSVINY